MDRLAIRGNVLKQLLKDRFELKAEQYLGAQNRAGIRLTLFLIYFQAVRSWRNNEPLGRMGVPLSGSRT